MKLTVPLIKCLKNIYGALCDLVAFVQFKNVKDTHGGVLILIKLQAKTIFIEKESKAPYGCPTFIFYQKYF